VLSQLPDFARNDIPVMLSGEIGLSKELSQAMVTGVQRGARAPPMPMPRRAAGPLARSLPRWQG